MAGAVFTNAFVSSIAVPAFCQPQQQCLQPAAVGQQSEVYQAQQARLQKIMHNVAHLHTVLAALRAENQWQSKAQAACSSDNFSPECDMENALPVCGASDDDDCCSTCGEVPDCDDLGDVLNAAGSSWGRASAGSSSAAAAAAAAAFTPEDAAITEMLESALAAAVQKAAVAAQGPAAAACWCNDGADSRAVAPGVGGPVAPTFSFNSAASTDMALDVEAAMLMELDFCLKQQGGF